MKGLMVLLVGSLVLFGVAQMSPAAIIQIQLGGVDIQYDGSVIRDGGIGGNPDPLTNAAFLLDGTLLGMDTSDVTLDLFIPGVLNVPAAGGQVTSAAGGSLYLDLGGGEFLSLNLDSAIVSYIPITSTVQFVFAGAAASIDGQLLPFGLTLAQPVSVSFSTQISEPISQANDVVTSFRASGTGEIQAVPEPTALALMGLGALGLIRRSRRTA